MGLGTFILDQMGGTVGIGGIYIHFIPLIAYWAFYHAYRRFKGVGKGTVYYSYTRKLVNWQVVIRIIKKGVNFALF